MSNSIDNSFLNQYTTKDYSTLFGSLPKTSEASGGSLTDDMVLRNALNQFIQSLPEPSRTVFLQRYWYVRPVADIARDLGWKDSRVKMLLLRTRERLREHLVREGIEV